jgi:Mn-dependent DtxR family transcriptional regulator
VTQPLSAVRAYHDPTEKPRRKTQADRIVDYLTRCGRARTLAEIAYELGIADSTVSGRLNELKAAGIVDTYGERRCERNPKFRKQTWFLAAPGVQRNLFGGAK